ncbi:perlucin-like protein [Diadema antillarum]|uniref:perlucin-like protein n=1 Tax=Diadema antillarum TaxID=105358 RepID=UPI003A8B8E57
MVMYILVFQRDCCAETGEGACQNAALAAEHLCPDIFSGKTGDFVRSTPKYVPRDHPQYDAIVPEAARGKTNLYCAHPGLVCPGDESSPDSCYVYRQDLHTWEVARDTCDELGGYLVVIETSDELTSIRDDVLISHYGISITTFRWMWTGLNDRASEGFFTWERAGGTLALSSSMWHPNQPLARTAAEQDCGAFNGYELRDDPCSWQTSYICEFRL